MKIYKIKYQRGNDILIYKIKAKSIIDAKFKFYMKYTVICDILSIEEVT